MNLAKYLMFARILKDICYSQEPCKISIVWMDFARHLSLAKLFQYFSIGRTLQDNSFLHETRNFSINRKNHETCLVFAIILDES